MPHPLSGRELPLHPLGLFRYRRPRKSQPPLEFPSCRGGRTWLNGGYVIEYAPDHPSASGGAVSQQRLVMECVLGRILRPEEQVHHRDRLSKTNNSPDNLEVMPSRSAHGKAHADDTRRATMAPLVESQVSEALRGRSTAEAAEILGVNHNTLRNRFSHLLNKRRSPEAPLHKAIELDVRAFARDPLCSTRKACQLLRCAPATLRAWVRLAGVTWVSAPVGRPSRLGSGGDGNR